jgi:UDP-glucose 4-epimerase
VKDINQLTGQQLQPRFEPARAGDVLHSLADISAARSCLGYEVKVGWDEGLRQTLEFYRQEAKKLATTA